MSLSAVASPLVIDARGLVCPLPILRLQKALQGLTAGVVIELLTDDPAAVATVRDFCAERGLALLAQQEQPGRNKGETVCHRISPLW
ncbi:sulfurtransferase TusA family protein [Insolitispirillum peregrinum]|uniref:sulfurtransferase TusA family protein n=1 Tax=Insolitispirillum peregrinum TaxID=80876 RepID=UPI00360649A2